MSVVGTDGKGQWALKTSAGWHAGRLIDALVGFCGLVDGSTKDMTAGSVTQKLLSRPRTLQRIKDCFDCQTDGFWTHVMFFELVCHDVTYPLVAMIINQRMQYVE